MEDELEAWEDFYLPERVEMRVFGAIDMFPSLALGLQLIILAGKDGNIYAYENEVLHQVADSLPDLFQKGIEFPGTKVYNYGECFAPMTEEEYDELMEDEEVKNIKGETREFIKSNEAKFLSILARIEEKENAEKVASNKVLPSNHIRPKHVVDQMLKHADILVIFNLNDAYCKTFYKFYQLLQHEKWESNGNWRRCLLRFRHFLREHKLFDYINFFTNEVHVFAPEKGTVPQLQWHPNSYMLTDNAR
ncbi:uncharacterized protein LOC127631414 [Xyrauchen texanus]|nr:uncharacterized protein LOC127631414 [Xyrauchen texanus]